MCIRDSSSSSGSITSTITAWPQVTGLFHIPALRLTVFNPETRVYTTLVTKAVTISVEEGPLPGRMSEGREPASVERVKSSSATLVAGIVVTIVLLLTIIGLVLKRRKGQQRSSATVSGGEPEESVSAEKMKQQLFTLLEAAGIPNPGALRRKELDRALQDFTIPVESRLELSAVLDSLDKMLYSPSGKNAETIPVSIVAKVNDLLTLLKKMKRSG